MLRNFRIATDGADAGGHERRMILHCFMRTFPGRPYRDASMTLMAERLAFEVVVTRGQEGGETAQDSHMYGPHISRSSFHPSLMEPQFEWQCQAAWRTALSIEYGHEKCKCKA